MAHNVHREFYLLGLCAGWFADASGNTVGSHSHLDDEMTKRRAFPSQHVRMWEKTAFISDAIERNGTVEYEITVCSVPAPIRCCPIGTKVRIHLSKESNTGNGRLGSW